MVESPIIWIASIEAEYATPADWIPWADRHILTSKIPPIWSINLSLATTHKDAIIALSPAFDTALSAVVDQVDLVGLYLGFLYLSYERGDRTLLDLLITSGGKTDGRNYAVDCSVFYCLANEIDGGGPTSPNNVPLDDRVSDLYNSWKVQATDWWNKLITAA